MVMTRDIGDDVPITTVERDDFQGNIDWLEGVALVQVGRFGEAAEQLQNAVHCFERTGNENLPAALGSLGVAFRQLGKVDDSLKCYHKTADLLRDAGDEVNLPRIQQNAGNLCQQTQRNEEALHWFTEAKSRFHALGLPEKEGEIEQGVGCTLLQMDRIEEAVSAWNRARALFEEAGAKRKIAQIEMNLGSLAGSVGDSKTATEHLERAVTICRSLSETGPEFVAAVQMLVRAYMESGRKDEALKLVGERGLKVPAENNIETIKRSLRQYLGSNSTADPSLFQSNIRVLDLFPTVCDEIFEWFVGFTKRSGHDSGLQKAFPMRLALEALNALCVRVRESSPNQQVAEFMLAVWSVKYRAEFDEHFFAGLKQLKLAARTMLPTAETQQTNIQRLQVIEGLCRESDEAKFARYPEMKEMIQLLRRTR